MTVLSKSDVADSTGAVTVVISPQKAGVQWTVAQSSVETRPYNGNAQVTVRFNGNYFTSSAVLPSSAGGQPAITLQADDELQFEFSGCNPGDSCIVTVYYSESLWGSVPRADVV